MREPNSSAARFVMSKVSRSFLRQRPTVEVATRVAKVFPEELFVFSIEFARLRSVPCRWNMAGSTPSTILRRTLAAGTLAVNSK